ncbi:hypothetical protein, partial [Arthrobacter sp.]
RPLHSQLDLERLRSTGFTPAPAHERLAEYLANGEPAS